MFLLFLDTETTGLSHAEDQIIEIGGVIVDFDPVKLKIVKKISEFQSLVRLRQKIDDKITRITGITENDLFVAENLHIVQEKWADWLEPYQENIKAVIGHSVDFDVKFLKKESWYLPKKYKVIDTLNLSKIVFPEYNAINLEFLQDKLGYLKDVVSDQSHRALFDTLMTINLFQDILNKLNTYKLSDAFYSTLIDHFLPIDIIFNGVKENQYKLEDIDRVSTFEDKIYIDSTGKPTEKNINESVSDLNSFTHYNLLTKLLIHKFSSKYTLIILQLIFVLKIKQNNPFGEYKLHGIFRDNITFTKLLISYLGGQKELSYNSLAYVFSPFEQILTNIKLVADTTIDLGEIYQILATYIDIYNERQLNIDRNISLVQKWMSAYDFFIISLIPVLQNNEFQYQGRFSDYRYNNLRQKFSELCEYSYMLMSIDLSDLDPFLDSIFDHFKSLVYNLHLDYKEKYLFRYFKDSLQLVQNNTLFNFNDWFKGLISKYPNLKIETYLSQNSFQNLVEMLDLNEVFEYEGVEVEFLFDQVEKNIDPERMELDFFINSQLESLKKTENISLVLAGQNSTLKDLQHSLTSQHEFDNYLILGESGSLTKIGSKILRGFKGLVVIKFHDIHYLLRLNNIPKIDSVWIVNSPYFWIHKCYFNLANKSNDSENFINTLKLFYLEYQINLINSQIDTKFRHLKSYN